MYAMDPAGISKSIQEWRSQKCHLVFPSWVAYKAMIENPVYQESTGAIIKSPHKNFQSEINQHVSDFWLDQWVSNQVYMLSNKNLFIIYFYS